MAHLLTWEATSRRVTILILGDPVAIVNHFRLLPRPVGSAQLHDRHRDDGLGHRKNAEDRIFLHVVGRRADGYHLLQTVFRFIDWSDTLRFTPRPDGEIRLAAPIPGVPPDSDLTVRAARNISRTLGIRRAAAYLRNRGVPVEIAAYWLTGSIRQFNGV